MTFFFTLISDFYNIFMSKTIIIVVFLFFQVLNLFIFGDLFTLGHSCTNSFGVKCGFFTVHIKCCVYFHYLSERLKQQGAHNSLMWGSPLLHVVAMSYKDSILRNVYRYISSPSNKYPCFLVEECLKGDEG